MTNQESKTLTRDCIKTALMQLMQHQAFEDITVSAILERSGVSRAGFYRNYPSKEKVLEEIMQIIYEKVSEMFFNLPEEKNDAKRYASLFRYVAEQPGSIKKFIEIQKNNQYIFVSNDFIKERYSHLSSYDQYCIFAFWRGLRDIIFYWIENGMAESPDEMGELIVRLYNFDTIAID